LSLLPPFFLKSLEYRTDNLWVALWMIAVVVLSGVIPRGAWNPLGEDEGDSAPDRRGMTLGRMFVVGVILGIAATVSLKTSLLLFTIAVAGLVTHLMVVRGRVLRAALPTLLGVPIAPLLIGWYFYSRGAWPNLVYCVFKFSGGISETRHPYVLWVPRILYVPLFIITMRVAWRYRGGRDDDASRWRFFFAVATAVFFITLICFWVLISPRDYLPFLPFLAIFAVAAVERRSWPLRAYAAAALLFVAFIAKETRGFRDQTLEQFTMMNQLLRLTRPGEYVMDLKGETIYRPRPYYYIFEFITRNLMVRGTIPDTVPEDVVAKRCYVAEADGVFFPDRARAFLSANFVDLGRLRAAGQWIKPGGSFTIAVPGTYVVLNRDGHARGVLDGTPYAGARTLAAGAHAFLRANTDERVVVVWAPAYERGFSPFHLQDRDF